MPVQRLLWRVFCFARPRQIATYLQYITACLEELVQQSFPSCPASAKRPARSKRSRQAAKLVSSHPLLHTLTVWSASVYYEVGMLAAVLALCRCNVAICSSAPSAPALPASSSVSSRHMEDGNGEESDGKGAACFAELRSAMTLLAHLFRIYLEAVEKETPQGEARGEGGAVGSKKTKAAIAPPRKRHKAASASPSPTPAAPQSRINPFRGVHQSSDQADLVLKPLLRACGEALPVLQAKITDCVSTATSPSASSAAAAPDLGGSLRPVLLLASCFVSLVSAILIADFFCQIALFASVACCVFVWCLRLTLSSPPPQAVRVVACARRQRDSLLPTLVKRLEAFRSASQH